MSGLKRLKNVTMMVMQGKWMSTWVGWLEMGTMAVARLLPSYKDPNSHAWDDNRDDNGDDNCDDNSHDD